MERRLQRLNWIKVKKLVPDKIDTVIFPVGTLEAHGSACLGTDNFIPETIAEGIAERLNALVAPVVNPPFRSHFFQAVKKGLAVTAGRV